jgi:hypothetical protein
MASHSSVSRVAIDQDRVSPLQPLRRASVVCPGAADVARLHHPGYAIVHGTTSEDLSRAATADRGTGWTALRLLSEPHGRGRPDGHRAYHSAYFVGLMPISLAVNEDRSSRRYDLAVIPCRRRYHGVLRVL